MRNKLSHLRLFTLSTALLCIVLVISIAAHSTNMLQFPYFENDEGTYVSQAWSLITQGKLSPYTYWYDHAPGGWIFIALWNVVTGGFFTFGLAVDSGRVFMLVLHAISTFFLFDIAKKLTKQPWAGFIACVFFSLSPLALYFQRRVLLDNMMVFWVLLSYWLLLKDKLTLMRMYLSAITFAIAVLTKENAVFFLPAFWFAIFRSAQIKQRAFAVVLWMGITISVVSLYPVYAFLNNELFPARGEITHVSLIDSLTQQIQRGKSFPFWDSRSDFAFVFGEWLKKDRLFILLGTLASVLVTLFAAKFKHVRFPALLGILFWLFLLRGGLVIDFYIVPFIPILALTLGILIDSIAFFVSRGNYKFYALGMAAIGVGLIVYYSLLNIPTFTKNETAVQRQALTFIEQQLPKDSVFIVDGYGLVDLWSKGYTNAIWFWKLWSDPQVFKNLGNTTESIEYVFVSHEMIRALQSKIAGSELLGYTLRESRQITAFGPISDTYIDINQRVSTNGDWIWPMKVESQANDILAGSWNTFSKSFIREDGAVIDFDQQQTTSEGQSYGLLRAVYMNDRQIFDTVLAFTKKALQVRPNDALHAWIYKDGKVTDSESATDAEIDIALALIFASKQWNEPRYLEEAKKILQDIWKYEVVEVGGRTLLVANSRAERESAGYIVNPSYFSPAYYRVFAQVDSQNDWNKLADDTYYWLKTIDGSNVYSTSGILPPNWVMVSRDGTIGDATTWTNASAGQYGYDAFRTFFRVAVDALWYSNRDAFSYLQSKTNLLGSLWDRKKQVNGLYTLDGKALVDYPDISMAAGSASVFFITDRNRKEQLLNEVYYKTYVPRNGLWLEPAKYYDQNWAWFATALLTGHFPNIYTSH